MSIRHIGKSTASGSVCAPASKSYAHRLLMAAMLSGRRVTVSGIAPSDDILATVGCIRALGWSVSIDGDSVTVSPGQKSSQGPLECRQSGSTLRFMIPVALALHSKASMRGSERLFCRGLGEYENIFDSQGIKYSKGPGFFCAEGKLHSGDFCIDGNTSSQYVTGLMFALPLLEGDSTISITPPLQSKPYIDITMDVLHRCGVQAAMDSCIISIPGGQSYRMDSCSVEGDWSNAAFLDIYNCLGGSVQVEGLREDSLQGDKVYRDLFLKLSRGRCTIDLGNCIDLGPVLFTLAALKHGARFENTARLRMKESDRVGDILAELAKAGVKSHAGDNFVEIEPMTAMPPEGEIVFCCHEDHRLAMSLTALASVIGASISGSEAVAKSYPGFYNDIKKLHIDVSDE